MNRKPENRDINVTGIVLTVVITALFAWALWHIPGLDTKDGPLTRADIQANEMTAFLNLKRIATAQAEYKSKDWDGDGRRVYAMFYVHLWRSVSTRGEPIPVGLIPKRLGFAMDNSNPLAGYYYIDLRKRVLENRIKREFDYEKEWGAMALPGSRGRSGVLTFIVDQGGIVYADRGFHAEPEYPFAPGRHGWTPITTVKELKALQQTVNYPVD